MLEKYTNVPPPIQSETLLSGHPTLLRSMFVQVF